MLLTLLLILACPMAAAHRALAHGAAAPSALLKRPAPAASSLPLPPPPIPLPLPPDPHPATTAPPSIAHAETKVPEVMARKPAASVTLAATAASVLANPRDEPPTDAPPATLGGLALDALALSARRVKPADESLAAILLPFGPEVAAAAFRRGDAGYVVLDARRPIDMSALASGPVFGSARVSLLPRGTLLRIPLAPTFRLSLARRPGGWVVAVTRAPGAAHAIVSKVEHGSLALPLPDAAGAVAMPDPVSGADLLVGTVHEPGSAVAVTRHMPGFVLLRTWLGVAVEPRSDRLALHPSPHGFLLSADEAGGLPLAPSPRHLATFESAAPLTRRFDFPSLPLRSLARELSLRRDAVIAAPPLARFAPRLNEAETMIALGMGPEAEALLKLAVIDDPRHASDASMHGLAAIAALLAARPDRSDGLTDPRLSGSDEIALWRAARAQLLHQDPAGTAPVFAATAPLILAYPEPLARFLAPVAAEAMIAGGKLGAASRFLTRAPDTPRLDLARAALLAARGKTAAALAAYQKLARSPARPVAARAESRDVLLRFAAGHIGPAAAASALVRQLYAWRAPRHELRLRLKIADLRASCGQWSKALALLRRTQVLFPKDAAKIDAARAATFHRLFTANALAHVSPLHLVSLIEANADLIPRGPAGQKLAKLLADRLLALNLPQRAAPVLAKLMQDAPPGPPAAGLGAKLASARLALDDPKGALAALHASRAADLPPQLAEQRTFLYARAATATGHPEQAVAALAAFDDPAALKMRADLLKKTKHWARAETALALLVARTVPKSDPLSEKNKTALVELATIASEASEVPELLRLHSAYGARIGAGSLADTFHLLTDPPARSLADLPEVVRDTAVAERLPEEIKAIGGATQFLP